MATFPGGILDFSPDALPMRQANQRQGAAEIQMVTERLTTRAVKTVQSTATTIPLVKEQLLLRTPRYSPGALVNQGDGINKPRKVPLEYTWMKVN